MRRSASKQRTEWLLPVLPSSQHKSPYTRRAVNGKVAQANERAVDPRGSQRGSRGRAARPQSGTEAFGYQRNTKSAGFIGQEGGGCSGYNERRVCSVSAPCPKTCLLNVARSAVTLAANWAQQALQSAWHTRYLSGQISRQHVPVLARSLEATIVELVETLCQRSANVIWPLSCVVVGAGL